MPSNTNKKIKGNKTKNQAMLLYPSLHIKLRIHVQNRIYIKLNANTRKVLATLHENKPSLKVFLFPKFWIIIMVNANIEITK